MGQDHNHYTLYQHPYDYKLSAGLDWQGGHRGNTLKTHRCHHHDVDRHASLGAAAPAFCVKLHGGSSLLQQCLALCEWPAAENWQTAAEALMRRLCVRGAILSLRRSYHFRIFAYPTWVFGRTGRPSPGVKRHHVNTRTKFQKYFAGYVIFLRFIKLKDWQLCSHE